jgi:Methyltransferase FkbM domain
MPGGATVEQNLTEQLHKNSRVETEDIPITTLDFDIEENRLPVPQFVKIDVEGWELEVLRGARKLLEQYHPDLFLEMHGETMNEKRRKVAEIVDYLDSMGYRQIVHIETNTAIFAANSGFAAQGHLYCRYQ